MNNANESDTSSLPDARNRLREAARLLRKPKPIDPEVRRALVDLVEELGRALDTPTVPPAELARLAEVTANLTEALHHKFDPGITEELRSPLQEMLLQAETRAPTIVHIVERLITALANIGI